MKTIPGLFATVMLCALVSACASTNTRVSTSSDFYKTMGRSQQAWCQQFGCGCYLDGVETTCSLVSACLNSGNCQRVDR